MVGITVSGARRWVLAGYITQAGYWANRCMRQCGDWGFESRVGDDSGQLDVGESQIGRVIMYAVKVVYVQMVYSIPHPCIMLRS